MTEHTAASGSRNDGSRSHRVLLLMEAGEDRRLLEDWLGRRYAVTTGAAAAALDEPFDLCIVDEPTFARHTDALAERKGRAEPAFLPYLLVLGGREGAGGVDPRVWEHVDEIVTTPIEPAALQGRVTSLLARRELSTALAEREERIRRVLRSVPDPILVVEDGTIVEVNPAFEDHTGRDAGAVVGGPIADAGAFPPETAETLATLEAEAGTVERRTATVAYRSTDGTVRSAEVATAALPDVDDGDRTLFVLRDVTERLERERALEHEAERLDQFADMLAHELRNPLNIAQGYLGQVTPTDESGVAALDRVSAATRRMEQMIKELLAHARNDAVGDRRTVTLVRIAAIAWEGMPTADATLAFADEDATIEADPESLQTLFENLFRNAVEHGGTAVTVRVGPLDGGFYVEDDGPGIPPGDRETVFERGYTTDSAGTGLGLALVRQIADAHGWSAAVVGSDAGGARFEFVEQPDADDGPDG